MKSPHFMGFFFLFLKLSSFTGVDFKVKVMDATGPDGRPKRVKVTIWDTGKICTTLENLCRMYNKLP
jgi:hypothetical protein